MKSEAQDYCRSEYNTAGKIEMRWKVFNHISESLKSEQSNLGRIKPSSKTIRSRSIFQESNVRPNRRVDIEELEHNEWYICLSEGTILEELFDRLPVFQVD